MNMWAVSAMPVYSRRGSTKKASTSSQHPTSPLPPPPSSSHSEDTFGSDEHEAEFLGRAVDGPPSPESIRAFSKQVKRASVLDKHHSQQTTSSGSSSLRSLGSADRPSWENAFEGIALSRKSSGRSTSSSMPPRERPESVQIFGKTIFNRRGRLKRENSAPSSSEGSLHSVEGVNEAAMSASSLVGNDSMIQGIFNRRRTLRADSIEEEAPQRKYQISEPYNFQHMTHSQRDDGPDLHRQSRAPLAADFSQMRASQISPRSGGFRGANGDDMHFADFSSEQLPLDSLEEEDLTITALPPPVPPKRRRAPSLLTKQPSPPRPRIKHTRSQEQLRLPPPRPPRSPVDSTSPPMPPPRTSSRVSTPYDGSDLAFDRPQTSGGFRHPQPFAGSEDEMPSPSTAHGAETGPVPENDFSKFFHAQDDANWPLPCPTPTMYESPLPGVPEEEELVGNFHKSRASMNSTRSSLRASHSVPLLRQMSQAQAEPGSLRPMSGASDTLGRFDFSAAHRALKASMDEGRLEEPLPRESWEDAIDYCYDHAAEADCEYAWERPSLDISRDEGSHTPVMPRIRKDSQVSPTTIVPGRFDLPALSPASQMSAATMHEAITPTAPAMPVTSNFSFPRADAPKSGRYLSVQRLSNAESFKESNGFDLSPSFLIPKDYQQEMLAHDSDAGADPHRSYLIGDDELTLTMGSHMAHPQRASASTTGSNDSRSSGSERHISTTSTDLTRLTMSTNASSIDMDAYIPKHDSTHFFSVPDESEVPEVPEVPLSHTRTSSRSPMPMVPETGELLETPRPSMPISHGSHPSLPSLGREAAPPRSPTKRRDSLHARRGRARTASLSTPPPPGQYALFPAVQLSGSRI